MKQIPAYISSTIALLQRSYPEGLLNEDIPYIFILLYEHMSDRNLATVLSFFNKTSPEEALNDIYLYSTMTLQKEKLTTIEAKLIANGLIEWVEEE